MWSASEDFSGQREDSVSCLREWLTSQHDLHSRTDDDFLLAYLNSCEWDVELARRTITLYYFLRQKHPEWFAFRDVEHHSLKRFRKNSFVTVMRDEVHELPTLALIRFSRFGPDSSVMNDVAKMMGVAMEVASRRRNARRNGVVVLLDFKDYPWWFAAKCLWPSFCNDLFKAFMNAMPIRFQAVVLVNAGAFASVLGKLFQPFLPQAYKQKLHYLNDWAKVEQLVSPNLIPEEFGGSAGPLKRHNDAFIKEVISFREFLIDDDRYGYLEEHRS